MHDTSARTHPSCQLFLRQSTHSDRSLTMPHKSAHRHKTLLSKQSVIFGIHTLHQLCKQASHNPSPCSAAALASARPLLVPPPAQSSTEPSLAEQKSLVPAAGAPVACFVVLLPQPRLPWKLLPKMFMPKEIKPLAQKTAASLRRSRMCFSLASPQTLFSKSKGTLTTSKPTETKVPAYSLYSAFLTQSLRDLHPWRVENFLR